ncbi:hypothetical protein IFU04_25770 [Pseudomonas syringae]|nr:hypothetical protein [Pseudomonas syringae]
MKRGVTFGTVFIALKIEIFKFLIFNLMTYEAALVETNLIEPSLKLMMGATDRQDCSLDNQVSRNIPLDAVYTQQTAQGLHPQELVGTG